MTLAIREDPKTGIAWVEFCQGVYASSFNTPEVVIPKYRTALIVVTVSAVSGTTPSLVPEIKGAGQAGDWLHLATIVDTVTEGTLTRTTVPTVEGKLRAKGTFHRLVELMAVSQLRLEFTIAGTTPSFTIRATGHFR